MPTLTSEVRAARKWAQKAPDGYLRCRTRRRHDFPDAMDLGSDPEHIRIKPPEPGRQGVYALDLTCRSCGARGLQVIQRGTGYLDNVTRVIPPPDYKFTGGNGYAMDKGGIGQCRLEEIRRGMERSEEAAKLDAKHQAARSRSTRIHPSTGAYGVPEPKFRGVDGP